MSWLCVTGKPGDRALDDLGFRPTGEKTSCFTSAPVCRRRPDGSCLIVWYDDRAQLIEPARLQTVSLGADVVACHLHEGVMHSLASGWRDSAEAWSIEHFSERGLMDLVVRGVPPAIFADIRDDLVARQEATLNEPVGVDHIWDIPIELCRRLTGFRHDRVDNPFAPPTYEVLVRSD